MELKGLKKPNKKYNTKGAFFSLQEQRCSIDQADLHDYDTVNIYETPYVKDQNLQIYSSKELVNITNMSINEGYETLKTEGNRREVQQYTGKTEAKQKVYMFSLVIITVVVASIVSYLVTYMTFMNKDKDGGWSAWGVWSECSASCDIGIMSRNRTCNNPRPAIFGVFCEGENMQIDMCRNSPCNDGVWSAWGVWSECSASCDYGLKSRSRACNNPRPAIFGDVCEGENTQIEMCRNRPCNETHVAFSVYFSSVTGNEIVSLQKIIFTRILFNEGDAYDKTSGNFVAPFSGLYQFNAQICTMVGPDADYALVKEGKSFASGEFMTMANATDGKCTSFSAVAVVQSQEKVWVESHKLYQNDNDWNAFSGILIHRT